MYPVMMKLRGVKCLVVGGGQVGERKARRLIEEQAAVYLISREINEWFDRAIRSGQVVWLSKEYDERFLEGMQIVFATTSDSQLNSIVISDAIARGLWCNSATNPDEGNLILPAVFRKGKLTISVGTEGASPALARLLRDHIASGFSADWDRALSCVDKLRKAIQFTIVKPEREKLELFRELAGLVFKKMKESESIENVKQLIWAFLTVRFSEQELFLLKRELDQC